jgi:hypothetical protein
MATVSRGQIATIGDTVRLTTMFRSPTSGELVDLDYFPQISLQEPSGNVLSDFSSTGVYRLSTGTYGYDYALGATPSLGVWTDYWRGTYGVNTLYNSHNFMVHMTQAPIIDSDGYVGLGAEPGFNYSQNATKNINKLLWMLKARLNSSGKALIKDQYGNQQMVDCDIYTIPQLTTFLIAGLDAFNMIPFFTDYTFEDTEFFRVFGEIIVRFALIWALASKALIERGREFQINDNGVSFQAPAVSDVLMTQYSNEYNMWKEQANLIKNSMRGAPLGLVGLNGYQSSPAWRRLRFVRARQKWLSVKCRVIYTLIRSVWYGLRKKIR